MRCSFFIQPLLQCDVFRLTGIEFDRARSFDSCFVAITGEVEGSGQKEMRLRVARIKAKSMAKEIDGMRGVVSIQCEHAEVVEGAFVVRVDLQDGVIIISGDSGISLGEPEVAKREIGFGVVRDKGVSTLKMMLRGGEIIYFESEAAGIVGFERPKRGIVTRNRDKQGGESGDTQLRRGLCVI